MRFVITGIPRSGTSLLCTLVNHVQNVFCMNEVPAAYNVPMLPALLSAVWMRLSTGQPVPVRVNGAGGAQTTDTQHGKNDLELRKIDIDPSLPIAVGSKINIPYLNQIDLIRQNGIKVVSVVRDPVFAIASWNSHQNINEQYVMDDDFGRWKRYRDFPFKSKDRFGRQAEIWAHYTDIALEKSDQWNRYEDVVLDPALAVDGIAELVGLGPIRLAKPLPVLSHRNTPEHFPEIDLEAIRSAISNNRRARKIGASLGYDL